MAFRSLFATDVKKPASEAAQDGGSAVGTSDTSSSMSEKQRAALRHAWLWLREAGPFLLIFLLAFYLLTINVRSPWQSIHEDNGTWNETIALNHIKYGLGVTKGQDVVDHEAALSYGPPGLSEAQNFNYWLTSTAVHPEVYGHHPPLLGLTVAGSFLVFGYHYWAERLVPITFALLSLIVFYLLVRRVFDVGIARIASALYATYPIFAYYGRQISHESEVILFSMLLLYGYVRWREDARRRWLMLMGAATVLGGLYGWPLFYFTPVLFAIDWAANRRPSRKLALATLVPAAVTLVLVLAQLDWALGGDLTNLWTIFFRRAGSGGIEHGRLYTIDWLSALWSGNGNMFGTWTQLAMPFLLIFVASRYSNERLSMRVRVVLTFGLWGLTHIVLFRDGAYVHDYWQFYLIPFFALATAWGLLMVVRDKVSSVGARGAVLAALVLVALCLNLPTIYHYYGTNNQGQTVNRVVPLFDLWR